ncbi:exocyst subunit EXO70 family protein [Striga asiatica]|uniref:Exocyst subunit Exo70 family protein n=1 Tax=Striga asiatica TaxID=4170 RepID=A0A5A7QY31_STRAF|nr:exocyst subunit EXO70 family protein [Striga asiatica]
MADYTIATSSVVEMEESKNQEPEEKNDRLIAINHQLNEIQDKIMNWKKDESYTEAHEYMKAADQARKLIHTLENIPTNTNNTLQVKAHEVLETLMSRLADEFRHLLVHNRQPIEFCSSEVENIEAEPAPEDPAIELMCPDVISILRSITNFMFDSNYGRECSRVFVDVQRDALHDCLLRLRVKKLTLEDALKMEWSPLYSRTRQWVRAVKLFVRVHLAFERLLADHVFVDLGPTVGPTCFAESSRAPFLCLLTLARAIAVGLPKPEDLTQILDAREALAGLAPDVVALYLGGPGPCIWAECVDVIGRLGGCARAAFLEFESYVGSASAIPLPPGGGVHSLTKYVMDNIVSLTDYRETLDEVLRDLEGPPGEDESLMARHFKALMSGLEHKLEEKSGKYRDKALQHVFLINNVHYMAENAKNSKLRMVLGDDWIHEHNRQVQQHVMNYKRATWSSILALLRHKELTLLPANYPLQTPIKGKLQEVYHAFEEVYKSQTGWSVWDSEFREDLRISTSTIVVLYYRTFVGLFENNISNVKDVKYTIEDWEDYIRELFERSPELLLGHKR